MITNFLIGAVIVAVVVFGLIPFGRNWFDTMIRRAKKGECQ